MRWPRSIAAVLVWTVWLALIVLDLALVGRVWKNVPLAEDWRLVAPLTGHEPDVGNWLWAPSEEQPAPLPRLIGLGVVAITRDFRSPAVLSICVLGAIAGSVLLGLRRLRSGRTRYAHAVIPLVLLSPAFWLGQSTSALLQPVVTLGLAGCLLSAMLADPVLRTRHWALASTLALVLLPLAGVAALAFGLALAPWVAFVGWHHWPPRDPGVPADTGPSLLIVVLLMGLLVAVYLGHGDATSWLGAHSSVHAIGSMVADSFLSAGGPAALEPPRRLALGIALLLLLGSLVLVMLASRRVGEAERFRAGGVACMLVGTALAAAAGESSWATGAMLTAAVVVAWELYGPPIVTALGGAALLATLAVLAPRNVTIARGRIDRYATEMARVETDVRGGAGATVLAQRHRGFLLPSTTSLELANGIEMVGRAGIGELKNLRRSGSAAPGR